MDITWFVINHKFQLKTLVDKKTPKVPTGYTLNLKVTDLISSLG